MKAVIMAGGFGKRLMPITVCRPKPMIKLLDKPIIQYTLELLKKHNINDVCLTLGYMPKEIESFIISNDNFGMNINCVVENEPLGTAGSVKQCEKYLAGDDFIVISGDAVCDFNLSDCISRHYELKSKASVLLYSHADPLEFGLAVTDENGRIQSFIEKPSWDKVETNLINTGIYIFSNDILKMIPQGTQWDFSKDVFPELLRNQPVFGFEAEGYWCDVGNPAAYRKCARDILDGKTQLSVYQTIYHDGKAEIIPPVYISKDANVSEGAVIGPYTVLGEGSAVGKKSVVAGSLIDGAVIDDDCRVDNAIMCPGSQALSGVKISEGCIIGDETTVGYRAVLMPEVSIWPRQKLISGQLVNRTVVSGASRGWPEFSGAGEITGKYNSVLTPEICFALGAACEMMGKIAAASSDSPTARFLAESFLCGVTAAGGEAFFMDTAFRASTAYLGSVLGMEMTAFFSEENENALVSFTDSDGLPISRETERKMEAAFVTGRKRASAASTIAVKNLNGGELLYSLTVKRAFDIVHGKANVRIGISGKDRESNFLRKILTEIGCVIDEAGYGIPIFKLSDGGTRLWAKDENGNQVDWEHIEAILGMFELEQGSGVVAVPFEAPAAIDRLSDGKVLRLERDETAKEIYISQPWFRDGIFAAVRLVAAMSAGGEMLTELAHRIPRFNTASREVVLTGNRGETMRRLAYISEFSSDEGPGLLYRGKFGTARVYPMADRESLKITAESTTMEAAEDVCGNIRDMIENTDSNQ